MPPSLTDDRPNLFVSDLIVGPIRGLQCCCLG